MKLPRHTLGDHLACSCLKGTSVSSGLHENVSQEGNKLLYVYEKAHFRREAKVRQRETYPQDLEANPSDLTVPCLDY